MKIVEKKTYEATPGELWAIIHDPGTMPAWNPKCVSCGSPKNWDAGQRFSVVFEMKGKRNEAIGELLNFKTEQSVQFRYHYEDASKLGTVDEVFELFPKGGKSTLLVHTVDFSRSTLPYWAKLLVGFLGRFGKKMGEGPLDGIEALLP